MNARTAAVALFLIACHSLVHAQFSETVEVRITNVEAVVTDRAGKPVRGLTSDDFEIYQDGVKQEITNFDEITEEVPSATMSTVATDAGAGVAAASAPEGPFRRRLITVLVDDASLTMSGRNAVLPQLRKFLTEQVRPGDAVGIMTWKNSLQVELEPTGDRAAIVAAVDRLASRAPNPHAGWRAELEREMFGMINASKSMGGPPPISSGIAISASHASRLSTAMRQKVAAIQSVISAMRGMDGRKVLVVLTQSLSRNPGEEAFQFLDSIREHFLGANAFNPLSESRIYELSNVVSEIASAANGAGITLYPIHAGGKGLGINDIDASESLHIGMRSVAASDTSMETLHALAEDTGGKALTGSTNWQLAFNTIATDLSTYYSLGYRSSGERQDRLKNVDVRLKKRGYTVRNRKAVIEKTPQSEMSDAVMANLFYTSPANALEVKATTGAPTPAGNGSVVVPLTITVPMQALTLLPDGEDLVGRYSVFAAFLRQDGAVSKVSNQTQVFRFPASSLPRRKELTVKLDVTTDPQTGAISLGMMDETSRQTGFAVVKLN
jgi:VWFA-related protein